MSSPHLKKYRLLISVFIIVLLTANTLAAQTQFPEFSLSDDVKNNSVSSNFIQDSDIIIKRQLTKDILTLQEQINLLGGLVKRQSEIKKIADNYENMGLPFKQPLPELRVCTKLPVNVLCLHSYPDLKQHDDVISQTTRRMQDQQNLAMDEAIETLNVAMQKEAASAPQLNQDLIDDLLSGNDGEYEVDATTQEEKDAFLWSDIQCKQSQCKALIISQSNPNNRFRVSANERIDSDTVIVKITPTKVTAKIDGEIQTIQPMAIDGQVQPVKRKKQTEVNVQKDTSSQNKITSSATSTQDSNDLLGPTGLF